jgi:phosphoserine aminotransferase
MIARIHNFGAGPGVLPESVLQQAREDLWSLGDSGIGVMEHSHRGKLFDRLMQEADADCRALAGISDDYEVLFLQGGASQQFAAVPLNLLSSGGTADFLVTGVWSQKALKEAKAIGSTHVAATGEASGFTQIPDASTANWSAAPVYAHMTTNNTIYGTQWVKEPTVPAGVPLVADASSDIFSRPIEVSRYGLIYAGAQKNLGPSGVVLVIVRKDLVERGRTDIPVILQYRTHAKERSYPTSAGLQASRANSM